MAEQIEDDDDPNQTCVFCAIARGEAAASVLHEDELCVAFLNIRPIHPGEFMVIPRTHIDQFTDLSDALAAHIMVVAQNLGRKLLREFKPRRVGYVVHGFGVAHAHLNVVPQHNEDDIISARHIIIEDNKMRVSDENLAMPSREELDAMAGRICGRDVV